MSLNEWEQITFMKINPNQPLIYCQESIVLDDTTVLGQIEHISSNQHGFATKLFNPWSNILMTNKWKTGIYKNEFIAKEVQ